MKSLRHVAVLGVCIILAGCGGQNPVNDRGESRFLVAGTSGCYAVMFTMMLEGCVVLHCAGVVTGDLEGTVMADFDTVGRFVGVTIPTAANLTIAITGGNVAELIGETITVRLDNRNIFPPGQPLITNVGSIRAISGVKKANLTYLGHTDTSVDPIHTRLEVQGILCP
jgi:hypothetical protein